uniref:Enhancer binding protein-1 n=1 Tax=Entamoeba histolytica TaxID=5759 RepID=S0B0L0_ENTHI|nr:enhancer binding protein-1 [Entamoeba histolytica]
MTTLYVSHLDYSLKVEDVQNAFKTYNPKEVKIISTPIGYSRGFAFIEFATPQEAEKALEMDRHTIGKMEIKVQKALPKEETTTERKMNRRGFKGKRNTRKRHLVKGTNEVTDNMLFIKNLPFAITEEKLKEMFSKFGVVEITLIKTHRKKGNVTKNNGIAFITVKTAEEQKKAIAEMNNFEVEGRKITVAAAYKKVENKQTTKKTNEPKSLSETNVFVKNLPFTLTDEGFKKLFEKYDVVEATIVKRHNKKLNVDRSKGYGFVTFKTAEQQKRAIAEMDNFEVEGRKITVTSAYQRAEKKEETTSN